MKTLGPCNVARTTAALQAAKARAKRLGNPKLSDARRHAEAAKKENEQARDEVAASHSMTSSARASSVAGMSINLKAANALGLGSAPP
jgi:DNA invertase Pin-like site-specific DNA recombinase